MRRLIVNADDLGLAESVNRGIFESFEKGIVTSATAMTCGAAFPAAAEYIQKNRLTLGVGIHLTLTGLRPLSPPEFIPSLVDEEGRFPSLGIFMRRAFSGRLDEGDLRMELSAQITRMLDYGLTPDHIDGHHHIHIFPGISRIAAELGKRYGISRVRMVRENLFLSFAHLKASPKILFLRALSDVSAFRGKAWQSNDAFVGIPFLGNFHQEGRIRKTLARLPQGMTEFMVHPGYDSADLREADSYAAAREAEVRFLCDPETRDLRTKGHIALCRYSDLVM